MYSITQKLLNVTKNLILFEINSQLKNIINNLFNDLLFCFDNNKYIKAIMQFEKNVYNLLNQSKKKIIETLDNQFKVSADRLKNWNINKSNVSRTITTIYGDITFYRTYYESKDKKEKFFLY